MEHSRQLFIACEQGDVLLVRTLLDQGVEVDTVDDDDNTPLQMAAANGHENVVRELMMKGAALDKPNVFGWTPLMHACRHGHTAVVAAFLQKQADVLAKNRYGASSLTLAARGGHASTVRALVESGIDVNGIDLNGSGNVCEFTPLMAAAQNGHDAVLRYFIDRGCDVNYKTPSTGLTPLMLAARNGHMTTSQILIEQGADPNLINVSGNTALAVATVCKKREVRGYLDRKTTNKPQVDPSDVKPDIIEASKQGDINRIRDILDVDANQRDASSPHDGATPLMFAAMTGRIDIAELLVLRGCDINKQDTISGWTALMQATYHGKKNVAMFLLNCGADVTVQARNGCTAFDMASLIDDVDTELLRQLAAKAMSVCKAEKGRKNWTKTNGNVAATLPPDFSLEDHPKSGLKAWWNRLSNRFRNLKFGRTFAMTNRLAPMPLHTSTSMQDLSHTTPRSPEHQQSQTARVEPKKMLDPSQTALSMTSYKSMLMETKKSATMYTLDINPPKSNMTSETLKPVIPPFLPAPSFALDSCDHSHRPGSHWHTDKSLDDVGNSTLTSRRAVSSPMKFLSSRSPGNVRRHTNSVSPRLPTKTGSYASVRREASSPIVSINPGTVDESNVRLEALSEPPPTPTNLTQPVGDSDLFVPSPSIPHSQFMSSQTKLFMPRRKSSSVPYAFRNMSNTTSPNSSTSGSSSITPQRSSHGKSPSSKGSTTSTLTPSPSPTPGKTGEDLGLVLDSLQESVQDDEVSGILKKLSLEKYHPIFEEQEVDMEAFLTLTADDLKELGISHNESRRQILTAIAELNTGKGRERQQFVDTMATYQSTLRARITSDASSDSSNFISWSMQDEREPHIPSAKSRSS